MAPEYAYHGQFSPKSDVFSFGVLILEIISGQKNVCFCDEEEDKDLLSSVSIYFLYMNENVGEKILFCFVNYKMRNTNWMDWMESVQPHSTEKKKKKNYKTK